MTGVATCLAALLVCASPAGAAAPLPPPHPERIETAEATPAPAPADADGAQTEETTAAAPEPAPEPDARDAARRLALTEMLNAYDDGRLTEGDTLAAAWETLVDGDPAARVAGEWLAIRAGAVRDFSRLAAFLGDNSGWPETRVARRRAEEALFNEDVSPATVIGFFARARPTTGEGAIALARAFRADGAESDARALARETWRDMRLSLAEEAALEREFDGVLEPVDHRVRFERMLFREDWRGAERMLAAFPTQHRSDLASLIETRRAVVARARDAEKKLDALPARLQAEPSVLFSRLKLLRHEQRYDEAARLLSGAPKEIDLVIDGDAWWNERRIVARSTLEAGDVARAYAIAANHAAQSPAEIIEAEWTAGWIALRFLEAPGVAAGHFARAAEEATLPISVSRVAYWRGRAAEAQGEEETAREHYGTAAAHPIAYYGQLALEALGETTLPIRAPDVDMEAARTALAELPAARALALLHEAGLGERAIPLYAALGASLEDAGLIAALGEAAVEREDPRGLLALGKAAVYRGLPLDLYAYPTLGIPPFEPATEAVDPALVYAIARQESAFHPRAVSHAGARGLMQLMPATARATARRFGLAYAPERLLSDPAYNATLGSAHLAELIEDWGGSYVLTFAAYNAGGGAVQRWLDRFGDPRGGAVDPIDWVEMISFPETRNYVQRVMENFQVYRRLLHEDRPLGVREDLARGARR
ncbi:transglycosylase SLT domain-containing protein [Salinarimonas sp.]|uniref:lytic transglycosylase domain-containing protein n=1 Tax=Salinarimonas sp. TaxID=2766526 RepID=UPI0032D94E91